MCAVVAAVAVTTAVIVIVRLRWRRRYVDSRSCASSMKISGVVDQKWRGYGEDYIPPYLSKVCLKVAFLAVFLNIIHTTASRAICHPMGAEN